MTHDIAREINQIQQCLSQDKRLLGVFLGAGCPMAIEVDDATGTKIPLIPGIAGITSSVRDELKKSADCSGLLEVVETNLTGDGLADITIEEILSHIRGLRVIAGNAEVRGLTIAHIDKLDEAICSCIHDLANKVLPDTRTPYHQLASWIDATPRDSAVEVFTTNYDLLMEQAFESCRIPYVDGFVGSRRPFIDIRAMEEDHLPSRWARLWKLHGSLNWYQDKEKGVFRATTNETGLKRVIHPSHLKYEESRRMPYLVMMDRLRGFFKQPSATLFTVGYSFRDDHINEAIIQGLEGTSTSICFSLMFEPLSIYPKAVKLASERPNLRLLAKNAAVISGVQASWAEKDGTGITPSKWIKWTPKDPANANGPNTAELTLGNFSLFGELLNDVMGATR